MKVYKRNMAKYSYTVYDGKIYIEYRQLVDNKIIDAPILVSKIANKEITAIKYKKNVKKALVEFNSLPTKILKPVIKIFGVPPKIKNGKTFLSVDERMKRLEKALNKIFGI